MAKQKGVAREAHDLANPHFEPQLQLEHGVIPAKVLFITQVNDSGLFFEPRTDLNRKAQDERRRRKEKKRKKKKRRRKKKKKKKKERKKI